MKKAIYVLSTLLTLASIPAFSQNVGIGTKTPNPSAALDISDSTRGLLMPRLTSQQRKAIKIPATGLMIYQLGDSSGIWYFDKQWRYIGTSSVPSGFASSSNVSVFDDITDFASFSGSEDLIFVKEPMRGGFFYPYDGARSVDNGMIFIDASDRKWIRYVEGNKINVQWYGAKGGSAADPTDNYNAVMDAIAYIDGSAEHKILFIPAVKNSTLWEDYYYFNQTIELRTSISIEGEGYPDHSASGIFTKLLFVPNITCFFLGSSMTGEPRAYEIKKLYVRQYNEETSPLDITAHAFDIRGQTKMEGVFIRNVGGDGIHIEGCALPESATSGNPALSVLTNVNVINANNGFFTTGCDANIITFINVNAANCRRWGIWDAGELGNTFITPHLAYNGTSDGQCIVIHDSKYYVSISDVDDVGHEPGPNSDYWTEVTTEAGDHPSTEAWDIAKTYHSGGCYHVSGENAWSTFLSPYTEVPQPPASLNKRSLVLNGDNGAGVYGGGYFHMVLGALYLMHANLILPQNNKIGIHTETPAASLHVKRTPGEDFTSILESDNTRALMDLRNSGGGAAFGSENNNFVINAGVGGSLGRIMEVHPSGVLPGTDNSFDLGSSSVKWQNIWANNHYGTWQGNAIGAAYGGTGLTSLTPHALLAGGTTSTGAMQQVDAITGTIGKMLKSNGPSALPSWADAVTSISFATGTAGTNVNISGTSSPITTTGSITINVPDASSTARGAVTTGAQIFGGAKTFDAAGAASTPAVLASGAWYSGGTATTTKPLLLIEPATTTSTGWSTLGTGLGVNSASSFAGNLADLQVGGVSKFSVNRDGDVTFSGFLLPSGTNGSSGQVLTLNSSLMPVWQTAGGGGSSGWELGGNSISGSDILGATNSQPLKIYAGGYERMKIATDGKVGIGTSSPGAYLHISPSATLSDSDPVFVINANTGSGSKDLYYHWANGDFLTKSKNGDWISYCSVGSSLYDFYPTVRIFNNLRVSGALCGTSFDQTTVSTNSNGITYKATGDGGSFLIAHHFTAQTAMTGTNSCLASFDNGGSPTFTIKKEGCTSIGTALPDNSAMLEVSSTTRGFLPPRMLGSQAEAIGSKAEGLMVYSTDGSGSTITSKGWWGWDGSTWVKLN